MQMGIKSSAQQQGVQHWQQIRLLSELAHGQWSVVQVYRPLNSAAQLTLPQHLPRLAEQVFIHCVGQSAMHRVLLQLMMF